MPDDNTSEPQPAPLGDARHIISARCKNGHVSHFDKRSICADSGTVSREIRRQGGKKIDDIYLPCQTCGEKMVVPVDCEDYK